MCFAGKNGLFAWDGAHDVPFAGIGVLRECDMVDKHHRAERGRAVEGDVLYRTSIGNLGL
jgi:hypothetical protein